MLITMVVVVVVVMVVMMVGMMVEVVVVVMVPQHVAVGLWIFSYMYMYGLANLKKRV